MELMPGASLGPYKIERALGSGAMGAVYLAYDQRLDRRVALKMLTESAGAAAQQRLRREARAIARLNHPNIAALYDVVEQGDIAVLVMEYVDGEPLSATVKAGPLSPSRAVAIGLQLTDALAYAHREGIIHRDIKPANVMLTRDGKVKVLDLGIARIASADASAETRDQTETAIGAGTPAYMAPERLRSHPADVRTDIYSVGVLLFELVTGRRPFDATDAVSLSVAMGTTPPPRASTFRPDVPRAFDDVIARAMAIDRKARYESASDLHDALIQVRDKGYVEPFVDPRPVPRPVNLWRRALVVGAVLIALAVIASMMLRQTPAPQRVPETASLTLAIPPVINDRPDEREFDEFGALLQSVLARNLVEFPGIKLVASTPSTATAGNGAPGYVTKINLRHAATGIGAGVQVLQGGKLVLNDDIDGNELTALKGIVNAVASALEQHYPLNHASTAAERESYRRLPTQNPEALKSYLRGRMILDTSDNTQTDDKASAAFQEAIGRDVAFAFAQAGLSQAYSSYAKHAEQSDLSRAQTAANTALDLDLKSDQAHLALALVHLGAKNSGAAVEEARNALGLTPDSDDAHRILGQALIASRNVEAGLAELRTAVALRGNHWINYYALGRSLLVADKPADAIVPLQTMRDKVPMFESAWVNLGYAQLLLGQWDQSVGNLKRALDLNPQDHFALNNLATAYYWQAAATNNRGKFGQALKLYLEAVKFYPGSPKLYMNLGDTYAVLGDKIKGDAAYQSSIHFADEQLKKEMDQEVEAIAAKCQAKLGHFEDAEGRALKALVSDDKNTKVLQKLAVIYALWNKPDDALKHLQAAVSLGLSPVLFRDDPDLSSLHPDSRFQKLVAAK